MGKKPFDDMRRDTHLRHASSDRSPDVVNTPTVRLRSVHKISLATAVAEVVERVAPDYSGDRRGQRNAVRLLCFHDGSREDNGIALDELWSILKELPLPLGRQDEHSDISAK